jgi:hypothetical protein
LKLQQDEDKVDLKLQQDEDKVGTTRRREYQLWLTLCVLFVVETLYQFWCPPGNPASECVMLTVKWERGSCRIKNVVQGVEEFRSLLSATAPAPV